jgi:hypothetical protein
VILTNTNQAYNNHQVGNQKAFKGLGLRVFNATFNNISAISRLSVLLVEEREYP